MKSVVIPFRLNGKTTSGSIDEDLFNFVARYFKGDEALARKQLALSAKDLCSIGGISGSDAMRKVAYQWVVKDKLLK